MKSLISDFIEERNTDFIVINFYFFTATATGSENKLQKHGNPLSN